MCAVPEAEMAGGVAAVSETGLTGGPVRFDYTALDAERGRLFVAHMGAGALIDVDVRAHAVVRTLPDLRDVHGVIVVPDKHRVYATATGSNQVVAIDEDSGQVVFRAPTDTYPDGLAYDPIRRTVWTTNEAAGTETVIDATPAQSARLSHWVVRWETLCTTRSSTRWWSRCKAATTWPS